MKTTGLSQLILLSIGSFPAALGSKLGQKPLAPENPAIFSEKTDDRGDDAPTYRDNLVALHKSLVAISSTSGTENEVGNFLVDYLAEREFVVKVQIIPQANATTTTITSESELGSGSGQEKDLPRFNVVAWRGPGFHPSPKVLVTSHLDTVPPYIPYSINGSSPLSADTMIAGRGTVDAKASVAAQITALLDLLDSSSVSVEDVMLLYVVGEENTGVGMRFFSDNLGSLDPPPQFKAAVFGEPTEQKLACGHKGFFACTVTAHGKAGHSGYPWLSRSANEVLMRGLIKVLDTDFGSSEEFGNTTINVGIFEGGVAPNVIAELATAKLAGRVAIGPESEGGKIVVEAVKDVLRGVDAEAFEFECNTGYGVVKTECDVEGFETAVMNYGTDVGHLAGNHKRYLYGPGSILVAHGPDEAIRLGDLETAVEDFKKLILHAIAQ